MLVALCVFISSYGMSYGMSNPPYSCDGFNARRLLLFRLFEALVKGKISTPHCSRFARWCGVSIGSPVPGLMLILAELELSKTNA